MKLTKVFVLGLIAGVLSLASVMPALAAGSPHGPLQHEITYYTANNNGPFTRSKTPFTGIESQKANRNGSVTVSINGATGYADSGFVIYDGTLGGLNSFNLTGTGDYGMNLWFDKDKDGEFFNWSSNVFTGVGADTYALGPASTGGNLAISDSSAFFLIQNGVTYTLLQLKNGGAPGIDSTTPIAIWVGVTAPSGGDKTATVSLPSASGYDGHGHGNGNDECDQ